MSEGSADDKQRAIRRSEYLSYALATLHADEAPTVIFGFAFGDNDAHILTALKAGRPRSIAISVYRDALGEDARAELEGRLHPHQINFFDAETHPMGLSALHCG